MIIVASRLMFTLVGMVTWVDEGGGCYKTHDDKTNKPKTNSRTRSEHPQPRLTCCQTLGINAIYRCK